MERAKLTMSASCPKCGVALVPGYVKCPRCHAVIPGSGRFRRNSIDPGGTVLEERSLPILPIVGAGIVAVVVLIFVVGGGSDKKPAPAAAAGTGEPEAAAIDDRAAPTPAPGPPRTIEIPSEPAAAAAAAGPDPRLATGELERALGRQRLWSAVQASGDRVEIRSSSCGEAGMAPTIDASRNALRSAGLTRLRCVAQSGAVVWERDL